MSNQFPPPPHDPQAGPQQGLPSYGGPAQDPAYGNAPGQAPGHGAGHVPGYGPAYGPGYGYGPAAPLTMPGVVRAAQIIMWVLGGLVLLGTIAIAASGDAETAGAAFGSSLCLLVAAGFAFTFKNAGHGIRVTCIVLMSVQIALGLGSLAAGNPAGLLGLLASIATVVLLSQGAAGAWFKRPRTHP
ncbi:MULTISPECIES: DUF3824 domain-containing protein [Streptomyces]